MHVSAHLAVAVVVVAAAVGIAIPVVLDAGAERTTATDKLSVPTEAARPALATAEHAMGPIVPKFAGMPEGNPFTLREKGARATLPIPEPPPPRLDLPDPPPTPFAPGR